MSIGQVLCVWDANDVDSRRSLEEKQEETLDRPHAGEGLPNDISESTITRTSFRSHFSFQLPTLSLLRADHSSLTTAQWTLLSNITHAYDEFGGVQIAERFLLNQRALPIKLRFKLESVGEMLAANMGQVQRILERNVNYRSLSGEDRSILLRRSVGQTSCLGATFAVHHSGLLSDPYFSQSAEVIFTEDVMATIIPLTRTFDPDITFLKLLLSILAFSTAHSITSMDNPTRTFHNPRAILQIQDSYVELAWKYMVHKYTYEHAVKRFCHLLRFLFNVNRTISQVNGVETYRHLIDTVVERTEKILSLKD